MNPAYEDGSQTAKSTLARIKWPLIILLVAAVIAGSVFGVLKVRRSAGGGSSGSPDQETALGTQLNKMNAFFKKTAPDQPAGTILCQGVILSATRGARAIINGETAGTGVVVNGARILEITASNVLVECNGQTRRLAPGESFIPKRP